MGFVAWVNSLSPSAAQFWGAAFGVGGGLTAILLGAFFNATLNRRRDDRLRDIEGRAVAAALRGELASMKLAITDRLPIWTEGERMFSTGKNLQSILPGGIGAPIDASAYAKLPPHLSTIFEANASRLGLLGSHLAGAVTVIYTNYLARSEIFKQPTAMMSNDLPEHFSQQISWGKKFCEDCEEIESFLIEFEKTGNAASLTVEIAGKQ